MGNSPFDACLSGNRRAPAFLIALAIVAASLAACNRAGPAGETADLLIRGGIIYTGVDAAPTAEAVGVRDGVIIYVGDAAGATALAGPGTKVVDLQGAALYPGFTDAHAHLLGIGMRELTLNLEGVGSIDELVDIVGANVNESEPGALVYGRGWIETGWPEARFPTRDDLDPVSPNNPVVLVRADGHALVANSAALAAAGVDEATPDPEGGRIEKGASGRPTGMFIDRAMGLLASLQAAPTDAQKMEAYKTGAAVYAAYGWTGVHNMSVNPGDVPMIERLAAAGGVPIRVYNAIDGDGLDWLVENPGGAATRTGAGAAALIASGGRTDETGRIITRAIKLYADGALGSRGAALMEPYADQPETSGLLLMRPEDAKDIMARALKAGIQVSTHAIGDRGNKLVLDWYEEVLASQGANWRSLVSPRWRIEHAQVLRKEDIPRFATLGVIPSMQASHAIGDLYFAPARLGPDRLDGAYAWRSLIDAGTIIAGGSDAPVERGDPRVEFYAAVARKSLDGFQGDDWRPGEAVTRAEALKMLTAWPAYASFREHELGSIEVGKQADFTALSKDIMVVPEAEILTAAPVLTVVAGAVAFDARNETETNQ